MRSYVVKAGDIVLMEINLNRELTLNEILTSYGFPDYDVETITLTEVTE